MGSSGAGIGYQRAMALDHAELVKRVDRLALVCQALWSLLQERTDLTDDDLTTRITEMDLKDGALDGKYEKPVDKCPKCGSGMSKRFQRCLFCGEKAASGGVFDNL